MGGSFFTWAVVGSSTAIISGSAVRSMNAGGVLLQACVWGNAWGKEWGKAWGKDVTTENLLLQRFLLRLLSLLTSQRTYRVAGVTVVKVDLHLKGKGTARVEKGVEKFVRWTQGLVE